MKKDYLSTCLYYIKILEEMLSIKEKQMQTSDQIIKLQTSEIIALKAKTKALEKYIETLEEKSC